MDYNTAELEAKWKAFWKENEVYKTSEDKSKPKYYVLDMFPYPSGAGLHVGHPLGYIASDIYARYKRLQGFNVLHPMGYDAFGLPAEQYAIQTGVHPAVSTNQNINFYRKQLDNLGFSFDWDRSVNTSDPKYYKWTQTIFLKLFSHYYNNNTNKAEPVDFLIAVFEKDGNSNVNAANSQDIVFSADEWNEYSDIQKDEVLMNYRLAYRKVGFVNWCEELGTVLANDEVKDGLSERGGFPVIKNPMRQWALRITAYAERLLTGLNSVDFSEALKTQQRNWIGRSEGARMFFNLQNHNTAIEVFTTRPDTLHGVTFMVLAPEHPLVDATLQDPPAGCDAKAIQDYVDTARARSDVDRMADGKNKTGHALGLHVTHPATGQPIPIWMSDYVLMGYGHGAVMAVPGHDNRDHAFAIKYDLPVIEVVQAAESSSCDGCWSGDGIAINSCSDQLDINGLGTAEAKAAVIAR